MLKEVEYKVVYSTGEDEPIEFFLDSLMACNSFDLGLGFFSSSGFRALSLGFAYFISRGGKMRILINDILSPEDKEAILRGQTLPAIELIEEKVINDLTKLYEVLSKQDKHFFNCLSWMIATKKIEFKAIVPLPHNFGIAHQKFGIFKDKNMDAVAFSGSANFSNSALHNNLETLSCYKSWTNERSETARVNYFDELFRKFWNGKSDGVQIIPIEKVKTFIRQKFPVNTVDEILDEEMSLLHSPQIPKEPSPGLKYKLIEIENRIKGITDKPGFPNGFTPHDYQNEAVNNWIDSGFKGFFEMATGTGKTITALNCALYFQQKEKKIRMLILVPSLSLADQWTVEAANFNFKNIIIANSNNANWDTQVLSEINKSLLLENSFTIVTTYATFALDKFQSVIRRLSDDVLIIADEAHSFGTKRLIELYPYKFARRIGLSATPRRHFDEEGTQAILGFFNAIEKPTFKLDMKEAIEKGFLCEYYYFPKLVHLNKEELDEYKEISKKLLKFFDGKTKRFSENPIVSALLLKRKRIIHKAEAKKDSLRNCLCEIQRLKGGIKYTLVYVPEGSDDGIDEFDRRLIDTYSEIISEEFKVNQHQFIGETANRGDVLARFSEGKLAVLTAMKCLDEGVDIKRTEIAIFCSSTGNPRQFVQRRGRILRTHAEKKNATIFDMIVIPDMGEIRGDANLNMEKSILRSELRRVYEFASLSINKYQALKSLEEMAETYSIDIFSSEIS